jgi:nucleoid DNA-binding protein
VALEMVTAAMMVDEIADATGQSKGTVREMLAVQEDVVVWALENAQRVKIAGVQIEPKLRPATKKRMGRNPATGEPVEIAAKPASVVVKARVLASLKNRVNLPTTRKLKSALGTNNR